jgi:hypothetical protein
MVIWEAAAGLARQVALQSEFMPGDCAVAVASLHCMWCLLQAMHCVSAYSWHSATAIAGDGNVSQLG